MKNWGNWSVRCETMGLLAYWAGKRKAIAEHLAKDEKKRLALWEQHLANYLRRKDLCQHFSYKNIDAALKGLQATGRVLEQIEGLMLPEMVILQQEEKLEEEIIADLGRLKDSGHHEQVNEKLIYQKNKEQTLRNIFAEMHATITTEIHLLRHFQKLIKEGISPQKDLLIRLFRLIFFDEFMLYKPFMRDLYRDRTFHDVVVKVLHAVILEKRFKEELESDEEKFVRLMVGQMGESEGESPRRYRGLAEDIYFGLITEIGAPFSGRDVDITDSIKRLEVVMSNDKKMIIIIKKLRPKYDVKKVQVVMLAFRKAYKLGHLLELEAELVT